MFPIRAKVGAVLAEGGEACADVALPAEFTFQKEGAAPEGLPTQGGVAVVVGGGIFEFFAGDFDLGVVKEPFFFVGPVAVFFLGALVEDPGAEAAVEAFESDAAFLIKGAQPLPEGTLVGGFLDAQKFEKGLVGAEFFDIGEAGASGAVAEDGGDDVDFGVEAAGGVFAMIKLWIV